MRLRYGKKCSNRSALNQEEWDLIAAVGNQVDLAIANLSLFQSIQQTAHREQIVGELTAELQKSDSVDDVLERTLSTLQTVLEDYDITIRLTPGEQAGKTDGTYKSLDEDVQ